LLPAHGNCRDKFRKFSAAAIQKDISAVSQEDFPRDGQAHTSPCHLMTDILAAVKLV
jgi:hypothetical protein